MNRFSLLVGAVALVAGGCTTVEPIDYAKALCDPFPRDEFSACASRVIDHYRAMAIEPDSPFGHSTSGPFALAVGDALYLGNYHSDPFTLYFRAEDGANVCRGAYDAFAGSRSPILEIHCDDGSRGTGELILDRNGRNGVGDVDFDDGRRGRLVFGHGAVGGLTNDDR